ncbi:MAG: arsenate reductase (glutaredoxin) [Bacteroidales bacterium]|nr:arsenate reductase (glutaredoxin) [Bacteroidales bacterium]
MKIYHFPRCSKSRAGLNYLREKGYEPQIVQYLKDEPFTEESLKNLLMKLNKKPQDIIRTQEKTYKQNFKGKNFTEEEWVKILVENPRLLQRPIVETKYKAVIGNPPENIDTLL